MADAQTLLLSSSPHVGTVLTTRPIMARVLVSLAPVSLFGIFIYGLPALLTIAVSVAAAEIAEALFRKATRQELRNGDLSAAVTGLLLALVLPPGTPLWMTALGAVFAIVAAKEFFGGIGANVFNPALVGRAFLLMSFPAALTTWNVPGFFGKPAADALTGATPLGIVKAGGDAAAIGQSLVSQGLAADGGYPALIKDLFFGYRGGCVGESSVILILAGFVFLLAAKIIDWRAPLAMAASAFALSALLGRDPLVDLLSGGLLFGAVFMATDYTSAPLTQAGKLVFGLGAGIITILIRRFGSYPEGASYGILIMNAFTPFLNRLQHKKYGYVKPVKKAKEAAA